MAGTEWVLLILENDAVQGRKRSKRDGDIRTFRVVDIGSCRVGVGDGIGDLRRRFIGIYYRC